MDIYSKYADLLIHYSLELKKGDRLLITSSYLAEPLVREVYKSALRAGGHPVLLIDLPEIEKSLLDLGTDEQIDYTNPFFKTGMEEFETFLNIRAPYNLRELQNVDGNRQKRRTQANKPVMQTYFARTGSGAMRRSLCQFPTPAAAQDAGMSVGEYRDFVFNACYLNYENPIDKWLEVRKFQQRIVDVLDKRSNIRYVGPDIDIRFSTKGRTWINSDGRANMPSGEVFTAPVEDSVNGKIRFSFPGVFMGNEVEDIRLEVKDGVVVKWTAKKGQEFLDRIFSIDEGSKRFGEAAIGTNMGIQRFTRNILFDEKIGGTIHMAIGQSYHQCGGKNDSSIHWDMIADMTNGGEIYADDELIYKNGNFLV